MDKKAKNNPGSLNKDQLIFDIVQENKELVEQNRKLKRDLKEVCDLEKPKPDLVFTIPGKVVPKGRPRLGRGGHVITPPETKRYEELVKWSYKQAARGQDRLEGALRVEMDIYMYIPKSDSLKQKERKRRNEIRPTKAPDWDNMAKSITDGLNGLAYKDDAYIVEGLVRKWFGDEEKAIVKIYKIK